MLSIILGALLTVGVQAAAPDPSGPSAIEHALVEFLCRTTQPAPAPGTDAYQSCYTAQLTSLRESFGRDLARLSAADRRTLDAACGRVQETRGRDAYLACLNAQLASVRNRRARGKPAVSRGSAPPAAGEAPQPDAAVASTPEVSPAPDTPSPAGWWIAAILATAVVAGGGAFLALRTRRPRVKCRTCGGDVPGSGDLCPACRHEAAESLRRAAAERVQEQQAQQDKARRQAEQEQEEARREQARREEALRLRQQEEERLRQEQEQRAEEARRRTETSGGVEETFDPYAVLGVAPDAAPEAIRAAHERLKAKYDENEYAHLGAELQDHFKAKAQAVERAYAMLGSP